MRTSILLTLAHGVFLAVGCSGNSNDPITPDSGSGPVDLGAPSDAADPDSDAADPDSGSGDADSGNSADGGLAGGCDFDDSVEFELRGETLQLVGSGNDACVILHRTNDRGEGQVGPSVPFTLTDFLVYDGTNTEHVTDRSSLSWTSTHHNWGDSARVIGATTRYDLVSRFAENFTDVYSLSGYDKDSDELLWGPLELIPYEP